MIKLSRTGSLDFEKLRILVIDDEAFSRNLFKEAMSNLGAREVRTARDGFEALSVMREATRSFDVVISDYRMPEMDGLELLKEIRVGTRGVNRDTIFAILTGQPEKHICSVAFMLDVDFFVTKPASAITIKDRLAKIITSDRIMRSPLDYEEISTEIATGPGSAISNEGINLPRSLIDDEGNQLVVHNVTTVNEGAVLGQDLFTSTGELIIQSGQVLTAQLIARLRSLAEVDDGTRQIVIRATASDDAAEA